MAASSRCSAARKGSRLVPRGPAWMVPCSCGAERRRVGRLCAGASAGHSHRAQNRVRVLSQPDTSHQAATTVLLLPAAFHLVSSGARPPATQTGTRRYLAGGVQVVQHLLAARFGRLDADPGAGQRRGAGGHWRHLVGRRGRQPWLSAFVGGWNMLAETVDLSMAQISSNVVLSTLSITQTSCSGWLPCPTGHSLLLRPPGGRAGPATKQRSPAVQQPPWHLHPAGQGQLSAVPPPLRGRWRPPCCRRQAAAGRRRRRGGGAAAARRGPDAQQAL